MVFHTMEYYSAFKRKEILSHDMAYMNLEHIMQSEIINKLSQNKRPVTKRHILWFPLYKIPRAVKCIDDWCTNNNDDVRGWECAWKCLMDRVSVLQDEKSSADGWLLWLHNNMNVNTTDCPHPNG